MRVAIVVAGWVLSIVVGHAAIEWWSKWRSWHRLRRRIARERASETRPLSARLGR